MRFGTEVALEVVFGDSMSLKELLGVSFISLALFPVVVLGVLLATGVVHLEMGSAKERLELHDAFRTAETAKQDSAEAEQLKTYKALEAKSKEVADQEAAVQRELDHLENLKQETSREKDQILAERQRIETLVAQNGVLQDKQIQSLADVYGSMRPEEAAPILLSLQDPLVVKILRKITDADAASKLLAAVGALDVHRAAHITELMGKSPLPQPAPTAAKPAANKIPAAAPNPNPASAPKTKA